MSDCYPKQMKGRHLLGQAVESATEPRPAPTPKPLHIGTTNQHNHTTLSLRVGPLFWRKSLENASQGVYSLARYTVPARVS